MILYTLNFCINAFKAITGCLFFVFTFQVSTAQVIPDSANADKESRRKKPAEFNRREDIYQKWFPLTGIASVKLAYRLYPKIQHKLFKNRMPATAVMPVYNNRSAGFVLLHAF